MCQITRKKLIKRNTLTKSYAFKGALRDRVIFFLKILHNILSREKWVKLHSDFFLYMKTLSQAGIHFLLTF